MINACQAAGKAFTIDGTPFSVVPAVKADAGICTRPPMYPSRGFDILILNQDTQ